MKKVFLILITLLLLSSSCFAAYWKWLGSNPNIGLFVDTSSIEFELSKDRKITNRDRVYVWVKYVYDDSYAQKKHYPTGTKYAVSLEGFDLLRNKSIIQKSALYNNDGDNIANYPPSQRWEPIIPDTIASLVKDYLANYVPKHVEEIEQRTKGN